MDSMCIRIILADDHIITRSGIKALLDCDSRFEVVAEASCGREAVKLCSELKPDVVIMDISMPNLNGMEATRQILTPGSSSHVIALTMHAHRRYISGMLKAGASGYLLKSCTFDELASAITTVMDNKTYLSPSISETVVKDYLSKSSGEQASQESDLTSREREVLQLIAEGISTRDIAKKLFVSESTVNTHRRQIMEKLNIFSIAKLTKYAIQEGLTLLEG